MRFYYLTFVLLLLTGIIFPQEITLLDSSTYKPIYNVNIISLNSDSFTTSDENGKFDLSVFSPKDSLQFSHVAFKTQIITYSKILLTKKIFLSASVIEQQNVQVTDKKYEKSGITLNEKIDVNKELKESYINAADILKTNSSIFIKDYGGFAGIKTISVRGMSSENTIVLFNEARVNDLQTGVFDLSTISSQSISTIEFSKSFDDESSYSSAGGVLKIFTGNTFEGRKLKSALRLSTDNYKSVFLEYSDGNEKLFFNVNGERSYSPNKYDYTFEDKDLKRSNAHFNRSFFSGTVTYNSEDFHSSLYSGYSYLNSGIPGFVVTNNYASSRATNKSNKSLSILNSKYKANDYFGLNSVLSYNRQTLLLYDPDGYLVNSSDNQESNLSDFSFLLSANLNFQNFIIDFGNEFSKSSLDNFTSFVSSNLVPDKIDKTSNKIFANLKLNFLSPLKFINNFSFLGKINYDIVKESIGREIKTNSNSYDIGISIIPATEFFLSLKIHYGNNLRIPTFNERYYSNLYNHYELNPERYKICDAGADFFFDLLGENTFSLAYFNIDGTDKIIWIPTRLALQTPRNISIVKTNGVEVSLNKKFPEDKAGITFYYVYTNAKNKSQISANDLSFNKQLIYTPLHRFNVNFSVNVSPFTFSVFSSFVSERFYTTDNNPTYELPYYYVIDFSSSYNFELFDIQNSFSITIYNLLEEKYFVIQSYPMPLRTFLLTLNMELL